MIGESDQRPAGARFLEIEREHIVGAGLAEGHGLYAAGFLRDPALQACRGLSGGRGPCRALVVRIAGVQDAVLDFERLIRALVVDARGGERKAGVVALEGGAAFELVDKGREVGRASRSGRRAREQAGGKRECESGDTGNVRQDVMFVFLAKPIMAQAVPFSKIRPRRRLAGVPCAHLSATTTESYCNHY